MTDVLNDLLFNKGICINILDNGTLITYNNNMNKSCVPTSDVEVYKNELEKNNNKDIIFESTSKKYEIKSMVYAFAVDSDTYYFLTTSINPIDSTVTILKNQFLTVSIVILLLSFVVGFFISQKLSKPITTLSKSAKKVAKGDYANVGNPTGKITFKEIGGGQAHNNIPPYEVVGYMWVRRA